MYYVMIGNFMESGPYDSKAEAVKNCPPGRDVMNDITGKRLNIDAAKKGNISGIDALAPPKTKNPYQCSAGRGFVFQVVPTTLMKSLPPYGAQPGGGGSRGWGDRPGGLVGGSDAQQPTRLLKFWP